MKPCPHCYHGFAQDQSHPTEMRLKECEACRGTGRIPEPTKARVIDDEDTRVDDEINRQREHRHFETDHFGT